MSREKRGGLPRRCGKKQDAVFLAQPDSIAWLLNIRGGDVPYSPLPLAFAVLHADARVELFCDPRKITVGASTHLQNGVTVTPSRRCLMRWRALAQVTVGADRSRPDSGVGVAAPERQGCRDCPGRRSVSPAESDEKRQRAGRHARRARSRRCRAHSVPGLAVVRSARRRLERERRGGAARRVPRGERNVIGGPAFRRSRRPAATPPLSITGCRGKATAC